MRERTVEMFTGMLRPPRLCLSILQCDENYEFISYPYPFPPIETSTREIEATQYTCMQHILAATGFCGMVSLALAQRGSSPSASGWTWRAICADARA